MTDTDTTNSTDPDAPLPIDYDVPNDVDAEAAKILAVLYGVIKTLELIQEALAEDNPPEGLTQEHLDTLQEAFRTGERVQDHAAYEAFLVEGPSALPEDLADEISESLAPLASAYGVDLDRGADAGLDLADHLTADVTGWRGS